MPSLKMKTKSTKVCIKEKYGLHVCPKSNVISKNPLSRDRIVQDAEKIRICTQCSEDASVNGILYARDLGGDEIDNSELSNKESFSPTQLDTATDSATAHIMEPTPSTCTSDIETIFSPILESMDLHNTEAGGDNLYVPQLYSEDSDDCSKNSCEYQACNVSDFDISDLIFSASPTVNNSEFDNKTDTMFLPDYIYEEESNLLFDLSKDHTMLPFLESTLDTGSDHYAGQPEETIIDAIHQLRSYSQEAHITAYSEPDFDPQMFIRNLPDQADMVFNLLPRQNAKRSILILDLDETLVHSSLEQCEDADFTIPVFFAMKEHTVYVKQRPHLNIFLKRVAEMFEVIIFTASQSIYAKPLLDILDPEGKIISRRFYRESCVISDGTYMKDLTVLGVDLAKAAIIDNSPQVFKLQVNNGIPIRSWFDDPSDSELISLLPFLETLAVADDVRPIIAEKFGNQE